MVRKIVLGSTVLSWVLAAPAYAAGDGEKVGENIGNLLGGWAKSLYVGIAAVVALVFLLNRRFAGMGGVFLPGVVVGGGVVGAHQGGETKGGNSEKNTAPWGGGGASPPPR